MDKPNIIVSTRLSPEELDDLKVLCILQDKSIRELVTDLLRKELKLRAEVINFAKKSMPSKKEALREFIDKRISPRRGKQKPTPRLSLISDLSSGEMNAE